MSAAGGVDYLNRDLHAHLEEPRDMLFEEEDVTVVGHLRRAFESTGTKTWSKNTVEWFLIYLITELGGTPHTVRAGHSVVSVLNAFQSIVQSLVSRITYCYLQVTSAEQT